jgi:hypothetical protein
MSGESDISIKIAGTEVSDRCLYRETQFEVQANPIQGNFRLVLRDPERDFSVTAGQKETCHIDGVPVFGGYVMRIGMGNFFPAVDTTDPAVPTRKWILTGPDYNLLFDKRLVYDPSNPTVSPSVPSGKRTITKAFKYLMNHYVDVPANLDFTTNVDTIYDDDGSETAYGTEENGGLYVGAGKYWRDQMEDFADQSGVIYYIDADFAVHMHAFENTLTPWTITDVALPNTVQFRAGEYSKDALRIVTEAHVWGGSTIRKKDGGPGGGIVYAKYPDPPAANQKEQDAIDRLNTLGRWQMGEERAGQGNYLSQFSVNKRAKVIITGPTGAVPTHGVEGGFGRPIEMFSCTWFAHDVPGRQHIRPGAIQDIILYTQGVITRLPLRSMTVTFPTLPTDNPGGKTYVQFEGEFGTNYSDRRHLWKWLRKNRQVSRVATTVVDNTTGDVVPGAFAYVYPLEEPNGNRVSFTFPYTFYENRFDLFLNGLKQRGGSDFTYSASAKQVTFSVAPETGDSLYAYGYVSG